MTSPDFNRHRQHMRLIREAALQAADPEAAITSNLRLTPTSLHAGAHTLPLAPNSRIYLVALGKAAIPMTTSAAAQLGDKLAAGIAAVPRRPPTDFPASVQAIPAAHPLPDEGSLAAGAAAANLLRETKKDDLVVVLISGGGSAMFEHPLPGITLDDLRTLYDLILRSGAPIEDFNAVRRALSLVKAGGLARLASPARSVALILSDVVGDRLSTIASGPTVLRRATPEAARAILERYDLWRAAPESVRAALSLKRPAPPPAPRPVNVLVGSNRQVVDAAQRQAEVLEFPTRVVTRRMRGEARQVGKRIASRLQSARRPMCLLLGGETTVTVRGQGRGGRNQELALAAALAFEGTEGVALMSLATDGVDGPTDAAGAVVTGETAARIRALNVDPETALHENDSYPALKACDALIHTGPTGTNLNDLVVALAYGSP
jgi:hydroxypyruvate reductase